MAYAAPVTPPHHPVSAMGFHLPAMRGAALPGLVSVDVRDLFDDMPEPIHNYGHDTAALREAIDATLATVDLSAISATDSVNVLCSEHGFGMMGGEAYAELLKAVRDLLVAKVGCDRIRLGFATGLSKLEGLEILPEHGLDVHYHGRTFQFGPYDRGIEIDTEIGRLYGIGAAFKADKIVHVHYDDPREVHFHRLNGRMLKAFTMSYARLETRAVYHEQFPHQSANIVPRAIYESPFVQKKFGFAASLMTSPAGLTGIAAHRDLLELDRITTRNTLRSYGKMIKLFEALTDCIVVIDGHRWLYYNHAGGMTSCSLFFGPHDHLDIDAPITNRGPNPAVKALVLNYLWKQAFAFKEIPTISAQKSISNLFQRRGLQTDFYAEDNLAAAMARAYQVAGTRKVIVFDGSYGAINCSPELADELFRLAPSVAREVDDVHMPKWLRQRGMRLDA